MSRWLARIERGDPELGPLLAVVAVIVVAADVRDGLAPPRMRTTAVRVVFPAAAESPTTQYDRPRHSRRMPRVRLGRGRPSGTRGGAEPFWRSSISSIFVQQVLGHSQRGRVDQAAVQRDRAHARIGRLLHRGDDPARAGEPAGRRARRPRSRARPGWGGCTTCPRIPGLTPAWRRGSPPIAEVAERAVDRPQPLARHATAIRASGSATGHPSGGLGRPLRRIRDR